MRRVARPPPACCRRARNAAAGNDYLSGSGNGWDVWDDTAVYWSYTGETLLVRLAEGQDKGFAEVRSGAQLLERDTLVGIEAVEASGYAETYMHGNSEYNVLTGGNGADHLYGYGGMDSLHGGWDHDELFGGTEMDWLAGGQGLDRLEGGEGSDYLDGGEDIDTAIYNGVAGQVLVADLSGGEATVESGGQELERDTLISIENISATGYDTAIIYGDWLGNEFEGGSGNDWLYGFGGSDYLYGYGGNDHLIGGDDHAIADRLWGGSGHDHLYGDGTNGDDGVGGVDYLYGEGGFDTLYGGAQGDWLDGGSENDELWGESGVDTLYGGRDDDTLHGGAGNDTLHGDTIDNTYITWGIDRLYGDGGDDRLFGGAYIDYLYGGADNDTLDGEAGDDWLYGEDGHDTLYGGAYDRLYGGAGNDTFYRGGWIYGEGGSDTIAYDAGSGAISVDLAQNQATGFRSISSIENVTAGNGGSEIIGSSDNNVLTGGAGVDNLYGNDGTDILRGGASNDTLSGGTGTNILDGGTGNDTASYAGAVGFVSVDLGGTGSVTTASGVHSTDDTLVSIEHVKAGNGGSLIVGSVYDNFLWGGDGVDSLYGNDGADWLYGGESGDTLEGGSGVDILIGEGGADTLRGGLEGDYLYGDSGNDFMYGGGGDRLAGGRGSDTLTGGAQADRYVFLAGDVELRIDGRAIFATDTINGFEVGTRAAPLDVIDIGGLLDGQTSFTGTTYQEARSQGYLYFVQHGSAGQPGFGTKVYVDADGGAHNQATDFAIADLAGVAQTALKDFHFAV